ncbi:MAG: fused MFS/spermidine synthase [Planctomycetota bacterium]
MLFLYGFTIFLSATLLFLVQPMFAKMVLPMLGGTPAVWNTCMVFFQAMLLAGYSYAHATTSLLGVRKQAILHCVLVLLPLLVLPIAVADGWSPPTEGNPVGWLLLLLTVSVGLPFFVVSTTNPLLQKWFADTGHPAARDPYFLYAASNLGSMLSLLAYPVLLEPNLRLAIQSDLWTYGYLLLVVLIIVCAFVLRRAKPGAVSATVGESTQENTLSSQVTLGRRLRWIALSFVPSSLMLGVTTYITSDIASVPLLWIVPLALYLLTFIIVFSSKPIIPHAWMVAAVPWLVLPMAIGMASLDLNFSLLLLIPVTFFVLAMVCHGELALDRPDTGHLTEFYLWMSLGGVLGGMFNALLAPVIFSSVVEYPLAIVFACLLCPALKKQDSSSRARAMDLILPAGLAALTGLLIHQFLRDPDPPVTTKLVIFGVPAMICFAFKERPVRFGLGIAAILFVGRTHTALQHELLYTERSFFGIHRVQVDKKHEYHLLAHGTTFHGRQSLDPKRQCQPLAYYYPTGPIGDVFREIGQQPGVTSIGLIGLGAGGMVAYSKPGQHFVYYEIDPAVKRIAEDPRFFTFLSHCVQGTYEVILGDGRLRLVEAPEKQFQLIILDAFSSDSIPMHLVTREALQLYLSKLADGGVLAFHISNRYLDLEPVVAALAELEGLVCLTRADRTPSGKEAEEGKAASQVVVMARQRSDLKRLADDPEWVPAKRLSYVAPWTDDFSNILGILKW